MGRLDNGAELHHIMVMANAHRQSVSLTARQAEALQKEATRLEINVSDLIRRIVDQWLEQKS